MQELVADPVYQKTDQEYHLSKLEAGRGIGEIQDGYPRSDFRICRAKIMLHLD